MNTCKRNQCMAHAMATITRLTEHLGIPSEKLENSRVKVSGAVDEGNMIWYEALHNGTVWEMVRETEITFCANGVSHQKEEFLLLGPSAVLWLIEQLKFGNEVPIDNN